MKLTNPEWLDVAAALEVLHRAGFSLVEPRPFRSVSVATAAERLRVFA